MCLLEFGTVQVPCLDSCGEQGDCVFKRARLRLHTELQQQRSALSLLCRCLMYSMSTVAFHNLSSYLTVFPCLISLTWSYHRVGMKLISFNVSMRAQALCCYVERECTCFPGMHWPVGPRERRVRRFRIWGSMPSFTRKDRLCFAFGEPQQLIAVTVPGPMYVSRTSGGR